MSKNIKKLLAKTVTFLSVLVFLSISITIANAQATTHKKLDFFGNNISDWTVLTFGQNDVNIRWRILVNENPSPAAPGAAKIIDAPWGTLAGTDGIPAFGDYSGNGVNCFNVYRFSNGSPGNTYAIQLVAPNQQPPLGFRYFQWGLDTDFIGAEGDYDGDGRVDLTAVRQDGNSLIWYVRRFSDNKLMTFAFGNRLFSNDTGTGDIPLPGADYTGDGIDDPAVARIAANGQITWIVGDTLGNPISYTDWGNFNTDFIVPAGDYDGDGKADFMVWRASNTVWYLRTNSGNISYTQFGTYGNTNDTQDMALRSGDYDGDNKTDIAIYRPSNLTFYVFNSGGGVQTQKWGISGNANLPLANFGVR